MSLDTPAERAFAERRAQGLPEMVTDPEVLRRIAILAVDRRPVGEREGKAS